MAHRWLPTSLCLLLLATAAGAAADVFELQRTHLDGAAIVLAPETTDVARFAAAELQEHLRLVLGRDLPIVERAPSGRGARAFLVGVRDPADRQELAPEEGRYTVTSRAVYFYGDDQVRVDNGSPRANSVGSRAFSFNRTGSLFAVYEFLERELGVRWVEPGAVGVVAEPAEGIRVATGRRAWKPHFPYQHNFRSYAWKGTDGPAVFLPADFELTAEETAARRAELDLWLRRMRMGAGQRLPFGHAFSTWWEKYGQEHPEWFALNGNGVRGPLNPDQPDRVKMCVSNPDVAHQAVQDWLERRRDFPLGNPAVEVGLNDGGGGGAAEFCHCDACLALDVRLPGEALDAHLTDRYMDLANRTVAEARRHVPDAEVTAYAYAQAEQPPRRVRLADGVVLEFVTGMDAPADSNRALYAGWQARGARKFLFRPNDLCVEFGLPLGHEKRIFEHQQMAVEFGALGTDHDCVYGWWTGVSGLTYYVLARATMDPSQSFEHWEAEYAATFGAAAPEVLAYHRHWRRKFDEVIWPENRRQQAAGESFLSWHRLNYISQRVEQFYAEADFDGTDSLLVRGLERPLTSGQRHRLERLQLANLHSRRTFEAMAAVAAASDEALIRERAQALLDLRVQARDELRMNWWQLFSEQHQMGDATGVTSLLIEDLVATRQAFDCRRMAQPPVLDGRVDEPAWAVGRTPVGFADNGTAAPPKAATEAYLGYDDRYLYVATVCAEPHMDRVVEDVSARDGAVWEDNAVELFFDPGSTRRDFYQLIISSGGALLDGRKTGTAFDTSWDLGDDELTYAVGKSDDGWILEARIAWTALGLDRPAAGQRLRFNLNRDRTVSVPGQSEGTALSPTFGGYHSPGRFATLVLR